MQLLSPTQKLSEFLQRKMDYYYVVALNIVGNHEDAEDALHNAIFHLFSADLRKVESLDAYVLQVVRNAALDLVRKRKRERDILKQYGKTISESNEASTTASDDSDLTNAVMRAIRRLPKSDAEIVLIWFGLRDLSPGSPMADGVSHKQLAEILHITPAASRQRLSRAMKRLAEDREFRAFWKEFKP